MGFISHVGLPKSLYLNLSSPMDLSISQKADSRAPMMRESGEISLELNQSGFEHFLALKEEDIKIRY